DNPESGFEPSQGGVFMRRWGAGLRPGVKFSQHKLCFVAADRTLLAETLLELSRRSDCYGVKYSVQPKDGMYLGRCFMLEDSVVGELWQRFKRHPRLMCTVQDDELTAQFRSSSGGESAT
ncbi:MAG: hypothetical protein LN409_03990, partial [Candidatus Thermoplasmatota archaeon]|nr:hypothetical protein [Candidatus Thermoplasmatota archaeon]